MAQQYILDRYRVVKQAGSGGYGSVYHAFDTHLKRDVAIKVIELSEADVARARILATEERIREELGDAYEDPFVVDDLLEGAFEEEGFPEDPAFLDARDGLPAQQIGIIGAAAETRAMPAAHVPGEYPAPVDAFEHIPGLKEARMVAQLSDASIVTVHECVVEGTNAYIIMEYVEGKTLAQILREADEPLSLNAVAAVVSKVAQALTVAHESGVLHLDIKPDNVLVNAKGQVKVTDFGLATLADAGGRATTGGGTIGYMPIEQMRLEPLDERTDQWALGALTYELLTGENPFRTEDLKDAQRLIEESELVLPSLCDDELSPDVDDVVFTAMDLEPDARFASVSAFADALLAHLGDAKAGQKELAKLVKGAPATPPAESEPEPAEPPAPREPLVDRIGPRGSVIILRILAALGAACTCAVGLANVHLVQGSAYGLASEMTAVFFALVAVCAILALIKPHIGVAASLVALGVSLMANGAFILGLVHFVICAAWWYAVGREEDALAAIPLLAPLCGSIGFAGMAAVAAGALLSVGRATATAAFSAFVALVFASFGTGDVMGWNAFAGISFAGTDIQATFVAMLIEPRTWCIVLSWIAGAAAFSFLCLRGTRAFDIAGAILTAGILLFGVCAGFGIDILGSAWRPDAFDFAGALVPGAAAIAAAALGITDRARWEESEWQRYLEGPQTVD
ncbi:MAG: serine/threonine protein kinase [Eggerthellaceae bacterium]|nr:serine/threonine protein kinase [Eggerthellaceae bacterium]